MQDYTDIQADEYSQRQLDKARNRLELNGGNAWLLSSESPFVRCCPPPPVAEPQEIQHLCYAGTLEGLEADCSFPL